MTQNGLTVPLLHTSAPFFDLQNQAKTNMSFACRIVVMPHCMSAYSKRASLSSSAITHSILAAVLEE